MTIDAKIIADSISELGIRITTMELYYPRFIHAEFMTHRVFSRNSASSRAIPILKMLKAIIGDMAMPVHWGANQAGMQAKVELVGWRRWLTRTLWRAAGYVAVGFAWLLWKAGAHKQIVNRVTEPWSHIRVCVTATDWDNFYSLRNHPDAQPEIRELARFMELKHYTSEPTLLKHGEWHLPYVTDEERMDPRGNIRDLILISTARCASTSYKTVDGKEMTFDRAIALGEKLLGSTPLHASPAEHQATPDRQVNRVIFDDDGQWVGAENVWQRPELHGNLRGWIQHRKQLANENLQPVRLAA